MITQACEEKQLRVEMVVEEGTDFFQVKRNICLVTGATRQTRSTAWSRVTNHLHSFVEEGVSSLRQLNPWSAVVTQPLRTSGSGLGTNLLNSDAEAFAHLICVKTDLCCHGNVHTVNSSNTNPQQSDEFLPEIKQQSTFWLQQPKNNN